ncbi:uncharacterized protein LOC6596510 isoform X2 [Drosophila persimilis]|uniref:uncharacterized protein LOC6596510 isoform X2 n=1 Tax=Drosophila persimilis TaxID=7234 RepID=UPI000F08707F|nr:uncharacterized protein LOC6596510 isoform X2 [Drosophila persimilis]
METLINFPGAVMVADDIEQLNKFSCGGYSDESTIVYLVHPCRILSALEILGFRVVASSSTAVKQDYNEYMWTMRKEFDEPEPLEAESVVRENLSNIGREAASLGNYHKVDSPE